MPGRDAKGAEGPFAEPAREVGQYIEGAARGVRRAGGGKRCKKGGRVAKRGGQASGRKI